MQGLCLYNSIEYDDIKPIQVREIMSNYKSSPRRLAHFFEESRNGWKEKALKRQEKLRSADIKVRDLTKSRDKWKQEANEANKRLTQLLKETEKQQAKPGEKKRILEFPE